jgi:hypothetical protein
MSSVNFAIPEPCLIHLTMKVRTATCAGARAAAVRRRHQAPEECGLPLEPVLNAPHFGEHCSNRVSEGMRTNTGNSQPSKSRLNFSSSSAAISRFLCSINLTNELPLEDQGAAAVKRHLYSFKST